MTAVGAESTSDSRGRRCIWTTTLRLAVPCLPTGLVGARLAFVSDLHESKLYITRGELFEALERAAPRLLLLGGDYSAGKPDTEAALDLLSELSQRFVTFAVPGNADHYYRLDLEAAREHLRAGGGDLLTNESRSVELGGARIELVGLDDPEEGAVDVEAALAGLSGAAALRVALVHSPAAWQVLGRAGAHILLCGHTHGGQVRPPGLEAPVTHLSYPARLAAGLFRYREDPRPGVDRLLSHWQILARRQSPVVASTAGGPLMYVSRGVGTAILGVRLLCPPELVLIELQAEEADGPAEQQ
ncbi:MAG: metallophosphoesterase [Armatimonadota bacterium]